MARHVVVLADDEDVCVRQLLQTLLLDNVTQLVRNIVVGRIRVEWVGVCVMLAL